MGTLVKLARYIIVAFIVLSLNVSPAFGFPFNIFAKSVEINSLEDRLDAIDEQVWIISQDEEIMRFGNLNMWDQGISNISIQIMDNGVVQSNYYIQKRAESESATIHSGVPSHYDWVFKPTVKQAEEAIDIYKSYEVSTKNIIKSAFLIKSIETEDVPPITTIIDNVGDTAWNKITNHLPNPGNLPNLLNWIINLLS